MSTISNRISFRASLAAVIFVILGIAALADTASAVKGRVNTSISATDDRSGSNGSSSSPSQTSQPRNSSGVGARANAHTHAPADNGGAAFSTRTGAAADGSEDESSQESSDTDSAHLYMMLLRETGACDFSHGGATAFHEWDGSVTVECIDGSGRKITHKMHRL